jgi:hypothetical protein
MAKRFYSSIAQRTALADQVNATTGTFIVNGVSGWPANTPYTLIVDADTVSEEIVEVTFRSGSTLTVTRGVDGSTATPHDAGADVRHSVSGRDFSETNQIYYQASEPTNAGTGDMWVDSDETA